MTWRHFIFDVDGTLTLPRQPMTSEFARYFIDFIMKEKVHLISGSDIDKIKEQVPINILTNVESVHACSGNDIYVSCDGKLERYSRLRWSIPKELEERLNQYLELTNFPFKYGNHIEHRVGSCNFSVCGRNATKEDRDYYEKWDSCTNERIYIVERLRVDFPDIQFDIGGQISFDIYPKGRNKSQILEFLRNKYGFLSQGSVIFFGDKCYDGNDHPLVDKILEDGIGDFHNVMGSDYTLRILKERYED